MDNKIIMGKNFVLGQSALASEPVYWGSFILYTGLVIAGYYGFYLWRKKYFSKNNKGET